MRSILPRSCLSSSRELMNGGGGGNRTHLYLNVYDLTPINNHLYWFGLGIFHSGIEVHGMEYGFGSHDYSSSGVFEVEPKSCPGFIYRRSVWLGTTDMTPSEFRLFLEHLCGKYHGDTYHLIAKNCNHFTDDVCMQLTGKPIPGWVNRLARLGSFCNCLLPENIQVTTVRHLPDHPHSGMLGLIHEGCAIHESPFNREKRSPFDVMRKCSYLRIFITIIVLMSWKEKKMWKCVLSSLYQHLP